MSSTEKPYPDHIQKLVEEAKEAQRQINWLNKQLEEWEIELKIRKTRLVSACLSLTKPPTQQ